MELDYLKNKAAALPLLPGVYLMRDAQNTVIYVGKAKKLKNRVSQYFQDTASHSPKTRLMVSKVSDFEVIIAGSEFEALVLECSLIKQHMPKYNILLKDDKGYPFLRLDMHEKYPKISLVSGKQDDSAEYFGPFGSRGVTKSAMEAIVHALRLPDCNRKFPRDIGKGRPCLNYHMNQCAGWCKGDKTVDEYRKKMELARQLLSGNYKDVSREIRKQMLAASDELNFELAAALRDQLNAIEALGMKQTVTAGSYSDTDVIGYAQTDTKACFTVLHYKDGNLIDKEYELLSTFEDEKTAAGYLVKQYYYDRELLPKQILIPFDMEDKDLFQELLCQKAGRKITIRVPERGEGKRLIEMALNNATEEINRVTTKEENRLSALNLLGTMLSMEVPNRIESFDISNISGTDIVASMVVFEKGRPHKSAYKRFKINEMDGQDDYGSMRQVLERRFNNFLEEQPGFETLPDLLLIDGGVTHACVALEVLQTLSISVPVFGMVKDGRHRTRALVTPDGKEIRIDAKQAVFSLVGNIQEETHRFAISYHKTLRSKRLHRSKLDGIAGVGPKRKQELLKTFKSIASIESAALSELERVLPKDAAMNVYRHFHRNEDE